jgi:hypothetical protein
MSAFARALAIWVVAVVALAGGGRAAASPASQLYPIDLEVDGGEANWHAGNAFWLHWKQPPVASQGFPVQAVHFRVRNAADAVVVGERRVATDRPLIQGLEVPPAAGIYTAEIWLEGPNGELGPVVRAGLRFDDVRPGIAQPVAPQAWIAGNAAATVTLSHPPGPPPISGIRGYAVSIDRGGESRPCAAPAWCSPAETDLQGGIEDDTLSLGSLPEGISVLRAVAVSGSGVPSAAAASAVLRVDATRPEVNLMGTRGWSSGPVRAVARATDSLSGMAAGGPNGPYTAIAVDGGVPRAEPGDSAAVTVSGEGVHSVALHARDAAGNVAQARTVAVAIDQSPPYVRFARAQDPAEPERIEATVADPLSGADPGRGSIAVRAAGTRRPWVPLPTAAGRLVARWDSDSWPAGAYEFRVTGYDAAGNATSSERRTNGTRMILVNPLKEAVRMEAGLGGRPLTASATVPYGGAVSYSGRLTSPSQAALGQLPVEVIESFDAGAAVPRRSTRVLTAADGSFTVPLRPGPSRRVEAVFAGSRTLSRAGGGAVNLRVLAGLRMRASAATARVGGAPVVFSGRVGGRGAPIPAGGLAVELQFRAPGGDWAEFRTVQTDARGRYRHAYAFSDDDSRGIRFRFRAYMSGGGWPYEPAASRSVSVTGR